MWCEIYADLKAETTLLFFNLPDFFLIFFIESIKTSQHITSHYWNYQRNLLHMTGSSDLSAAKKLADTPASIVVSQTKNNNKEENEEETDEAVIKISASSSSKKDSPSIPFLNFNAANTTSAITLKGISSIFSKLAITTVVALYILNQQHMLPRNLSGFVSKTLFYPTLPITLSRRINKWVTPIDDTVLLGGAPLSFLNMPQYLHKQNVKGVINMCEEYKGPLKQYAKLGIEQLHLPTTDHFEPTFEDMKSAVEFINEFKASNEKVYVHCRAGHGRSAAIALAWWMSEHDGDSLTEDDVEQLNKELCGLRNVRETLYKQPNVNRFRSFLELNRSPKKETRVDSIMDEDETDDESQSSNEEF